ncbi:MULTISPECIES: acyl-CoA dehydrogenase family protein [unclassified Rhodococcus (in: high G+C Gram-positive bacteria)]|uniref:acyl-CoA dehydrogenase family protein n=1 Tax=unclassified Rhodococcus (in: high G+C Gram-positive bacteria) TaxID=192944 RepID=UPI00163B00CC|nr:MULTISPECIES: acyl-CoA dehydrogenase family protein [unclassified Rhodococcus (in: high G+C Gram-positive bacteria)]MBC2642037.1 acyl-CoA dehydrogenase family protein [Rhodococcus sp. 3A]MBC2893221.1 acyl-CoA dehydrogenase family protein [Rhodococcus sp. 4CII]
MDLEYDDATLAFRDEVRAFLTDNVPAEPLPSMDTAAGFEAHRAWERTLADARLSVVSWPEELGGRDASLLQWVVFEEEYYRSGAPGRVSQNGIFLLAPTLFEHANPGQLARIMPRMARADDIWAQAWSEPESGSDLASLRSTARRVDGGWVLNGQKTWSSRASFADWGFGLFRSDPDAQRHRGITYFMFDLRSEGVTVRPIDQLDGEPGFAEIFLEDVFVPDDPANPGASGVIGGVNEGWRVAMSTASNERGLSLRSPGRFLATVDRLVDLFRASERTDDTALRKRVADAWIGARAYQLNTFGTVTRLADGGQLGAESSINKVFWSEWDIATHETALELQGASAELADDWMDGYLFSLSGPIYAGTNEIQKNVIAERLLGLPKADR